MKIVADAHIPYIQDYFAEDNELILKPGRSITSHDVRDADILLVRSITPVNQALLHQSRVQFVGSVTAGVDHLDTRWLGKAGIKWFAARGFNAPPVADYVVCVVAALQRRQLLAVKQAKVAVIGVGCVGSLVARQLKQLGYDIILCDPLRAQTEQDFSHQPLDEISDVDLICLHVPLVHDGEHPTYHFINRDFLKRQKPNAVLLNASRGAVVDSAALMQYGTHLHWCLDVWEHEPRVDKVILGRAVIATPHIAGYSVQSKVRGVDMIYQAVCAEQAMMPLAKVPQVMPRQTLAFAGQQHHWQDIVMGIFNPLVMSAMMRAVLLPTEEVGVLFDELRDRFRYRHELAYTTVVCDQLLEADRNVLHRLGIEAL